MRPSRWVTDLAAVAILAAVYFVAGKLGLMLAFVHASATAVWPPTGIALAAFLLLGYRVWPGILLGAYLVHKFANGPMPSTARRIFSPSRSSPEWSARR